MIDLDAIAREVVEKGSPTLRKLQAKFGDDIVKADGTLDRAELGKRAFSDSARTKELNSITHGAIRRRMALRLVQLWVCGARRAIVDTPLLIEAGLYKWCAQVIVVFCSEQQQLKRMLQRDGSAKGLSEEDARSRLNAQLPLSEKLRYADIILDNSADGPAAGASPQLRKQIDALVAHWRREARSPLAILSWLLCWGVPPLGLLWGFIVARANARALAERQAQHESVAGRKQV